MYVGPELSLRNPLVSPWKILLETYPLVGGRDAEWAGTQALLAEYLSTELGGRSPQTRSVARKKKTREPERWWVRGEALSLFVAVALVPWFDLSPEHLSPGARSDI